MMLKCGDFIVDFPIEKLYKVNLTKMLIKSPTQKEPNL